MRVLAKGYAAWFEKWCLCSPERSDLFTTCRFSPRWRGFEGGWGRIGTARTVGDGALGRRERAPSGRPRNSASVVSEPTRATYDAHSRAHLSRAALSTARSGEIAAGRFGSPGTTLFITTQA